MNFFLCVWPNIWTFFVNVPSAFENKFNFHFWNPELDITYKIYHYVA